VLVFLCRSKEPMSCSQIGAYLGTSARSVQYDLDSVEFWLRGSPTRLVRRRSVGVVLEGDTEHMLHEMEGTDGSQCYASRADRVVGITGHLLWQCGFIAAYELAREFRVSVNAIYACLNEVSLWLAKRNVVLVRKPGSGLGVRGNEICIRQAMVEILWEHSDVRTLPDLPEMGGSRLSMEPVRQMLEDVLRSMGRPHSSHALVSLTCHMLVSSHRLRMGNQVALEPSLLAQLKQEEEWPVAVEVARRSERLLDVCFSEQEQAYIALRLRTARLGEEVHTLPSALGACHDLYALDAAYLVSAGVGSIYGTDLKNDPLLIADLATHLRASLYRLQSGLQTSHLTTQHLDDIKRYYPSVFRTTASACQPLERIYHVKMPEEEVGWIALHAAAALQRALTRSRAGPRALLAFSDRACIARMLEARLAAEFPEVEIVAAVPPGDLESSSKELHPDFTISTCYLHAVPSRAIVINPFLPQSDARRLRRFLDSERLPKYAEDLKIHTDSHVRGRHPLFFRHAWVGTLNISAADPADVIRQGCSFLACKDAINSQYAGAALENAVEFNSYSVVAPGLSLPHTRPSDGVNANFALIMVLQEPVMFGNRSFDPVRIVMLWGATDERSYAAFMDDILSLLRDPPRLTRLVSATSPDDARSALGWVSSAWLPPSPFAEESSKTAPSSTTPLSIMR
jgi:transcriptional antiterminator/mannitol/fructose-specific phosphotransferase system IIA component (Ntr-type)